jgi:translation initiation factor 5B
MPFTIFKNNKEELKSQFKKEVSDTISSSLSKNGIIAKADSLGSLEALLVILKQENIPVVKVGIGEISKSDVASAKANEIINEIDAVIVGFNVQTNEEAKSLVQGSKIKIITEEVVYKLIERLVEFRNEKRKEIEKQKLLGLTSLFKLKILHQYVFRNTKPAIFGVKVEAGKLTPESFLMEDKGEKIGRVKNIQSENKSVPEATEGMEVAISVPGLNVERQLKDSEFLYSSITSSQLKILQKNKDWLTSKELQILQKVAEIKPAK